MAARRSERRASIGSIALWTNISQLRRYWTKVLIEVVIGILITLKESSLEKRK
jgi:hypothetical protein